MPKNIDKYWKTSTKIRVSENITLILKSSNRLYRCTLKGCSLKKITFTGVPVNYYKEMDLIDAGGVQIKGVGGYVTSRKKLQKEPQLLVHKFTPYISNEVSTSKSSNLIFFLVFEQILILSHTYAN